MDNHSFPAKILKDLGTGAASTIEFSHVALHRGDSYRAHFANTTTNDDNHRSAVGFTTANTTKWMHLIIEAAASAAAEIFLLEAPTIDAEAGTQDVVKNRNRNYPNASGVLSLETSPTAGSVTTYTEAQIAAANFSGGTEVDHAQLVIGSGPKPIGGFSRGDEEWVLKQNTKYIVYIKNAGASANVHEIHLDWYEQISKTT